MARGLYDMEITCKICKQPFSWERNGGGRQPTICLSAECRKERDHLYYVKWKENHPITRYEKRKEVKRKQHDYEYRNTPKGDQWPCQRCGRMSSGRINCPGCRRILSDSFSQEYEGYLYEDSGLEDIENPSHF